MFFLRLSLFTATSLLSMSAAFAQVPVTASADHETMLASADPQLAENKRLVYDFYREVLEAGHLDLSSKYLNETYIQHNPRVPSGREAFVQFFGRFKKPAPIEPRVKAGLVSIVAERDLVILSIVREMEDPKDASKKYTTTWFDMFRVADGKIAQHWDAALKP